MIKLGAGTVPWAFAGHPLATALREIAATGISYVDVIGMAHGDPTNVTSEVVRECLAIARGEGLSIQSWLPVRPGTNIASSDQSTIANTRDYFNRCIELCSAFGAGEICFMAGHREIGERRGDSWKRAIEFSHWICDRCEEADLLATYELEWRTCGLVQSVGQMQIMLDDVGRPNLRANIDVGHAGLARDGSTELAGIGSRTVHIHLNDNDTTTHTNALPGDGTVPIEEYVGALIEGGMLEAAEREDRIVVAGIEVEDVGAAGTPPATLTTKSRDWILSHLPVEL